MTTLVLADHDNVTLDVATRHAITAAKLIDHNVHVLVAGNNCYGVADAAARIEGVQKVLLSQGVAFTHQIAEAVAPILVDLSVNYSHLVAPATSTGKNVFPRVAALLDVMQVSEISAVVSSDTFERPIYAGNAVQVVRSLEGPKVITVRMSKFDASRDGVSVAPIEAFEFDVSNDLVTYLNESSVKHDRPELTTAKVVVSGGRGMGSGESFSMLNPLADHLNGAIGASRAAVDAGFAPNDVQVGQTGKVVAPDLYIAVGISGAIQHLAGMKDSKKIIAINKDPDAPIFQVADIGLVGDLFEVLPQLNAVLSAK